MNKKTKKLLQPIMTQREAVIYGNTRVVDFANRIKSIINLEGKKDNPLDIKDILEFQLLLEAVDSFVELDKRDSK